jgi:hypothetical protein
VKITVALSSNSIYDKVYKQIGYKMKTITFTQKIANQIPSGLDRYDQIFAAKELINKTDSALLATCRDTLEEIEEIIFQRDNEWFK